MHDINDDQLFDSDIEAGLIRDLEKQGLDQIKQMRAHERIARRVKVELRPGNASQRHELHMVGKTGDISEGGCLAVFPMPAVPGDLYQLEFESKSLDLPIVYAQAMRCRVLAEDRFEVGFRFFTKIHLDGPTDEQDLLG